MKHDPLRLVVIARDERDKVQRAAADLTSFLNKQQDVQIVAEELCEVLSADPGIGDLQADLVVVVGGDGAILRACRNLGMKQLPLMGINLGRLGFLADHSPEEFRKKFPSILAREYTVVEHLMYECLHYHEDGSFESYLGLNEVAISSAGSLRMIDVNLTIDEVEVTTYSGDGLIVSTPGRFHSTFPFCRGTDPEAEYASVCDYAHLSSYANH